VELHSCLPYFSKCVRLEFENAFFSAIPYGIKGHVYFFQRRIHQIKHFLCNERMEFIFWYKKMRFDCFAGIL